MILKILFRSRSIFVLYECVQPSYFKLESMISAVWFEKSAQFTYTGETMLKNGENRSKPLAINHILYKFHGMAKLLDIRLLSYEHWKMAAKP